jgi:outer membrane protein assembly factor BamB
VQPPFGQVPGGGYPTAQPGGPSGGNKTGVVVAVVSAVVALAVLAVGAVHIFSGDDDGQDVAGSGGTTQGSTGGAGGADGGSGPQARRLFALQAPSVPEIADVSGAWATKDVFAKGTVDGVIGVDPSTGDTKWKLPLDGRICAASRQMTADHVTAVVSRDSPGDGTCSQLVVFDVDTGEKVWQKTMPDSDSAGALAMNVTVSGGTVAVAWIGGSVGYRLTGEGIWKADPDKDCRDIGYAGGARLVAVLECDGHDGLAVQTVDPQDGKGGATYTLPDSDSVSVISTDPLVLFADDELLMVGDDGRLTGRIATEDRYEVGCRHDRIEGCHNVAVGPDAVYLKGAAHGGYPRTNEVVAFDLTGEKLWRSPAGEGRTLVPLRVAGGRLLAYEVPGYDEGGAIVSLDAKTGRDARTELAMPADEITETFVPGQLMDRALYAGDRFYLQQHLISGDEKEYLAVGFGVR